MLQQHTTSGSAAYLAPTIARPGFTPPPPTGAVTEETEWVLDVGGVYHIEDPEGRNRRIFEGWASLTGLDYQDHELGEGAFDAMAQEYLSKNPILLWDHKRHLPIGTVHSMTSTEDGLYIQAEIWDMGGAGEEEGEDEEGPQPFDLDEAEQEVDIARLCDHVWWMIRTGRVRGLSIRGKARQYAAVWSPDLGKNIARVTEVLLYEISVTPTQVHPGAKIVRVNTLAKSLDLVKGLPLYQPTMEPEGGQISPSRARMRLPTQGPQQGDSAMIIERIRALQAEIDAEFASVGEAGQEIDIPDDVAAKFFSWGNSVSLDDGDVPEPELTKSLPEKEEDKDEAGAKEEDPEVDPADRPVTLGDLESIVGGIVEKALAPFQRDPNEERVEPEPRRSRSTFTRPKGSKAKPSGQEYDPRDAVTKAINILANSRDGYADMGKGEFHGCGMMEMAQLSMVDATLQGKFSQDSADVALSEQGRALLQSCGG